MQTHTKITPSRPRAQNRRAATPSERPTRFTPSHAHTTQSASASGTPPPVQFKGDPQAMCCPTEAGPTTVDQPKPPIPDHLPQPVKPVTDAPHTEKRTANYEAQSAARKMKSQERQHAAAARAEQRTARRAASATRAQSRSAARATRQEARASRHAARGSKTEQNQTSRRAAFNDRFSSAKQAIPQGVRQHFKKTRLREDTEEDA